MRGMKIHVLFSGNVYLCCTSSSKVNRSMQPMTTLIDIMYNVYVYSILRGSKSRFLLMMQSLEVYVDNTYNTDGIAIESFVKQIFTLYR